MVAVSALVLALAAAASSAFAADPLPLTFPRYGHGSVVVDGRLYVVGGRAPSRVLTTLESYDLARGTWKTLRPMPTPRAYAAVAELGRLIYVIGGEWNGVTATDVVEIYDPLTGDWTGAPPLPQPRWGAGAAVLDGVIYVAGGGGPGTLKDRQNAEVFAFDPAKGKWSNAPSLPDRRAVIGALTSLGGRLYTAGGSSDITDGHGTVLSRRWRTELLSWAPGETAWRAEASLPEGISSGGLAASGKELYWAGGSNGDRSDIQDAYSWAPKGKWSPLPPMPTGRSSLSMASGDGLVVVSGGSPGRNIALDVVEILDTRKRAWRSSRPAPLSPAPQAPSPRVEEENFVLQSVPPRPDDYALVIGLEDYRSVMAAQYGERDARAFARYATARLGVPKENVIVLTGARATKTDIAKYIEEWLPRNAEKDSRVFVYYSGHGAPDPETGESYLVPWDGDPQFLKTSGYPLERLYDNLEAMRAKKIVVFLDACFSGAGGRSVIAKNLRPLVHVLDAAPKTGKVSVLSASSASQVAGGSDARRHGLFTWHLLQALGGEAARDGHLDLRGLHEFVAQRVSKEARRENREQDPQLRTREPALRLY